MAKSPKLQEDRTDSVPPSRSSSVSRSSRRARRAHKRAEKERRDNEAGPSGVSPDDSSPKVELDKPQDATSTSFAADQDFIAFTFSDEEKNEEEEVEEVAPPVREWDKGKGKARDYEGSGRKRRHDEIDFNDGYADKKQRTDAASRQAPWAADVDWENCNNVAEMCVLLDDSARSHLLMFIYSLGSIKRWMRSSSTSLLHQ